MVGRSDILVEIGDKGGRLEEALNLIFEYYRSKGE